MRPRSRWRSLARRPRGRLAIACATEAALLAVAALVAWPAGIPLLADLHWSARDLALGLAATLPMFAVPWWATHSRLAAAQRVRHLLERRLLGFFRGWSRGDLLLVSIVAGVSEEVLFRAVVQGGLAELVGAWPALLAAGLLFGAAHPITALYAALAAAIGVYLGAIWVIGGNLLVPIVAHAAYDAAVLLWLLDRRDRDRVGPV